MNTELNENTVEELSAMNPFKLSWWIVKQVFTSIGILAWLLPAGVYYGTKAVINLVKDDVPEAKPKARRKS